MFAGCLSGSVLLVSTIGKRLMVFHLYNKLITLDLTVFIFTKNLHCPRNWIHVNLYVACFCRILADLLNEQAFKSVKGHGSTTLSLCRVINQKLGSITYIYFAKY